LAFNISTDKDFDFNIDMAIEKLKLFKDNIHKHILIDESQDIDDNRIKFIMNYYERFKMKSLFLFGDPRQLIAENKGLFFKNMWLNADSCKKKLSITHRFDNSFLLELCNKLSKKRENIHVELVTNRTEQSFSKIKFIETDKKFTNFIDEIKRLGNNTKDMVIISPSLNKNNIMSENIKRLIICLRSSDILVNYNGDKQTEDNRSDHFIPNGITITTIHGAKGKEWDYVFLFNMSNYPDSIPQIEYSVGDSLNFVAHTRAKKQLYYVGTKYFIPPRDIQLDMIDTDIEFKISKDDIELDKNKVYLSDDLAENNSLDILLKTNEFKIESVVFNRLNNKFESPLGTKILMMGKYPRILSDFYSGNYKYISDKLYNKIKKGNNDFYDGDILLLPERIRGHFLENVNHANDPMDMNQKDLDDVNKTYSLLNKFIINEPSEDIINARKCALEFLELFGYPVGIDTEYKKGSIKGKIDIEFKDINIIFGDSSDKDLIRAYILQTLNGKNTYIINSNEIIKIKSNYNIFRFDYLIRSFIVLDLHVMNTTIRKNAMKKSGINIGNIPENIYCVDTEFIINSQDDIFDISIVNVSNPYRSIITTLNIQRKYYTFASQWLGENQKLFEKESPNLIDVNDRFEQIVKLSDNKVKIVYYNCKNDVKFCLNEYQFIDASNMINLSDYGTFMGSNKKISLSELYNSLVCPLSMNSHIKLHHSLSDSLLLYEMIILNKLQL